MKNIIKILIIFGTLLVGTNCTILPPQERVVLKRPDFPKSEYDNLPKINSGEGTVTGESFLIQRGGGVVLGAGRTVYLFPWTSYAKWYWENRIHKDNQNIEPLPYEVSEYFDTSGLVGKTTSKSDGSFVFNNVPDGEYYLSVSIYWEVPNNLTQGGTLFKRFEVKEGKCDHQILNGEDFGESGYTSFYEELTNNQWN